MKKILLFLLTALTLYIAFIDCSNKVTGPGSKDVSVGVIPFRPRIAYGDSTKFYALVYNTTNRVVTWYVNGDSAGNDSLGRITAINDTSAWYYSPPTFATVTFDSVNIKARSLQDTTKSGAAAALLQSASLIYVDSAQGDDNQDRGTIFHPFRTLTKALSNGVISDGDTVKIGPGTYTQGELFPLVIPHRVTVRGSGTDSTRVIAPNSYNFSMAAFQLNANHTTIKNLTITGTNQSGVGIISAALNDTFQLFVNACIISDCYVGMAISGPLVNSDLLDIRDNQFNNCLYGIVTTVVKARAAISNTRFIGCDSAAISIGDSITGADDSTNIQLTSNYFGECYYGVRIKKGSATFSSDTLTGIISTGIRIELDGNAFLGSANPHGNNYFGTGFSSAVRCIYNLSPDSIYAQFNTWPPGDSSTSADSSTIDTQYIYDDDENAASGPVTFMPIAP
jgi:hypothetical protein